jgi:hypothetical protein
MALENKKKVMIPPTTEALKMKSLVFLVIAGCVIAANTNAGQITDALVTGVYCGIYSGKNMCSVYFNKQSNVSNSCASTQKFRMQLSADTEIGRAMLSLAITANAQGKIVSAEGTESCSIWPDTESLNAISLSPSCSVTNVSGCTNLQ